MLKTIVEKEIRDIISSSKFIVSFGLCSILILMVFYVGAKNYNMSLSQYQTGIAENYRQLDGLTDWSKVRETRIFLPPTLGATLVSGVANDIGRIVEVSRFGISRPYESRLGEEPSLAIFRFLDLEFLFGVVLSLFAIVLCYDAISGEKERGTLRSVFANSVPRSTYLLGKITGGLLAIIIPLLAATALGTLVLPILGHTMSAGDWGRLMFVIVIGVSYVSCFMAMSVLVSSLTRQSSSSLLILLVVWVVSIQLTPRAAVLLAAKMVDVPTVDELTAREDNLESQLYDEFKDKVTAFRPAQNVDDHLALQMLQRFRDSLSGDHYARVQELMSRLEDDRQRKQQFRARWGFGLARVSPAASLALALSYVTDTDLGLLDRYRAQTKLFQQDYATFMKQKIEAAADRASELSAVMESTPIDPSELPLFQYRPVPLERAVISALPDLGLLLVYSLLAFAGAFLAFNRYDLR